MKWMLGLCLAGLAAGAGAQGGARSEVRVGGENTSRVVIEGSVVNRAVGKGAVAETNIAGRRSVVRGDAESSVTVGVPDRPVDLGVDLVNAELAGRDLRGHDFCGPGGCGLPRQTHQIDRALPARAGDRHLCPRPG